MYDDDTCDTPACKNCGKTTERRGDVGDNIHRYLCRHCTKITAITHTDRQAKSWSKFYTE